MSSGGEVHIDSSRAVSHAQCFEVLSQSRYLRLARDRRSANAPKGIHLLTLPSPQGERGSLHVAGGVECIEFATLTITRRPSGSSEGAHGNAT